jgi:hypothetical protein
MLVELAKSRSLRKVKRLDAVHVLLQRYDQELSADIYALPDVAFFGRVAKVEFSL